jgi:hypothetical protein
MKSKIVKGLMLLSVFVIVAAFTVHKSNTGFDCNRTLVVQITGLDLDDIPSWATGTVEVRYENGTVFTKPYVRGQWNYEFYINPGYTGKIYPKLTLSEPISCSVAAGLYYQWNPMPCNTYYLPIHYGCLEN